MATYRVSIVVLVEAETESGLFDTIGEAMRPLCEDFGGPFVTWEHKWDGQWMESVTLDRGKWPVGAAYDAPVNLLPLA